MLGVGVNNLGMKDESIEIMVEVLDFRCKDVRVKSYWFTFQSTGLRFQPKRRRVQSEEIRIQSKGPCIECAGTLGIKRLNPRRNLFLQDAGVLRSQETPPPLGPYSSLMPRDLWWP